MSDAEARIKEYREKVEQLETDKANYHDKWLNALERLKAAEQEDARLREGIENLCVQQLKDENDALTAEVERLKSLLAEAHEAVCNWGSYAGDYFQEKWGWKEDCEKFAPFQEFYPKEEPLSPEQKQELIEKYMAPYIQKDRPDA